MTKHILFIDAVHSEAVHRLEAAGWSVTVDDHCNREELLECIASFNVLVVRSRIAIDRAIIDRATHLRCIARVGAGMETIDVAYAERRGIRCLNSPEGNRDAVGEHTLGLLLALVDRIARADSQVRQGIWLREDNRGMEILGKTVGIVGYGNMGGAFAQRLAGLRCKVIAYDIAGIAASGFSTPLSYVQNVDLQHFFDEAQIVSLHVPLTQQSRHMADASFFDRFRQPIYFINTSRGAVVDTMALANALHEGKVAGAALDVVELEEMSRDTIASNGSATVVPTYPFASAEEAWAYLRHSERTVLTPHVAGWTEESRTRLVDVLIDKICSLF